jgi:formyl-CoA transferase
MTDIAREAIEDWRVLDLGIITAGAATSAVLADFGANVIKIESKSYQDPFRRWAGKWDLGTSLSPVFQFTNRNKRGLELDLKTDEGRECFLELVAHSDVIVENFRRGVLDRLGLSYEVLSKANPQIVLASMSSQGDSGPDRNYASYGSTLDATGGLSAITGYPGDAPVVSGRNFNYTDQLAALMATGAIIAGVMHAKKTGKGAHLDIAQREITAFAVSEYITAGALTPVEATALRRGNCDAAGLVQGCYQTSDAHWLAITVPSESLFSLCAQLNYVTAHTLPEPTEVAQIEDALSRYVGRHPSSKIVADFANIGISIAPALRGNEILPSGMGAVARIFPKSPNGDYVKGSPFQQEKAFSVHHEAPALGEHTEELLQELLGRPTVEKNN